MGEENKEIWLTEKELEKLLQGSILWNDVASRLPGAAKAWKIRRLGEPFPAPNRESITQMELLSSIDSTPINRAGAGNAKIAWLLTGVAICTFGLWFYFMLIG